MKILNICFRSGTRKEKRPRKQQRDPLPGSGAAAGDPLPDPDAVPGDQLQQLPEILDVQQVDPDAAAGAREAFRGSGEAPGG